MHIFGGGNPLYQANKTTLKQQLNDEEKEEKNEEKWDGEPRSINNCFGLSYAVFVQLAVILGSDFF